MMKLTMYHRSTVARYEGTHCCDFAPLGVIYASGKDKGKKAGFYGVSWGDHPDAPDCLHLVVLDTNGPDDVEAQVMAKLTEWNLEPDPNQTEFPADLIPPLEEPELL